MIAPSTPMWGLVTANAISMCGTRLSQIAIPWLVLTTTGSASKAGVVAFAELAPMVLMQALGGPLIDRVGARRAAISADVASAVAIAVIPLLYGIGGLSFPVLVGVVALTGLARGPADAGHHALIPDVVAHTGQATERVTGLVGTTDRLALLVGAGAGGVVIAAVGAPNAIALNAASFAISALLLAKTTAALRPSPAPTVPDHGEQAGLASYRQELLGGFAFLRRDRLLLGIFLMVAVTNMLDQGYSSVLLPVWGRNSGHGPAGMGLIGACMGGAGLVGSLLATWIGARLPRYRVYVIGFFLAGPVRMVGLALGLPLPSLGAINLISGLGAGFLNPVLGALQFERIPPRLMGRVSAAGLATSWMLMPLGGVLAGFLTAHTTLTVTLLSFAALYLVAVAVPTLSPQWRSMNAGRPAD